MNWHDDIALGGLGPQRPRSLSAAILVSALAATAAADQFPIAIDGLFEDWSDVPVAYDDAGGDDGASGIDFNRLWLADDDRFLFLRLEVGIELDLSESNDLRLYLDTDADATTGLAIGGIGAELEFRLGDRVGLFRIDGDTVTVFHDDLRLRAEPTVTAPVFEIAIGRDTLPDGEHPLFAGREVRILLRDHPNGDSLPDNGQTLTYFMDEGNAPPATAIPLEREDVADVRLVTYNVLNDSPWNGGLAPRFQRQVAAVVPDILCFQEINGHSASETAALVSSWLPDITWHAAGNADCKTVTRFAILDSWPLDGNLAVLLDTANLLGTQLLVINAHLPCCANDQGRQAEADRIMAFIREAKEPGGVIELPPDTPIVIAGDMNFVGLARQLETYITGDIFDEGGFGPDFAPDWDDTDLANVVARQTEKRMGYTWRNDSSSFWPGHLDYIIHTDAVLELARTFILYTPEMSQQSLSEYGLQFADSLASDHLLFCADFRPPPAIGVPAELVDFAIVYGSLLAGDLDDLREIDDGFVKTRSALGLSAFEPNLMEMILGAENSDPSPDTLDLTINSSINHPVGTAKVHLRDWVGGGFDQVGTYTIGFTQESINFAGIDATDHVRQNDGRIELSVKHVVVAVFSAVGFESFFDEVGIAVN